MDTLSYKTISANKETARKEWVVIDASDQVVGRLCSKVAKLLRGKYKPNFTPHVDCGDNVIIINAKKVIFTGNKETDKVYTRYTESSAMPLRVCFPRVAWDVLSWVISTFSKARSTTCRPKSPRP